VACTHGGPNFVSFWGWLGGRGVGFFLVLTIFSSSSQHFLNSSLLHPIFFDLSFTLCNLYKQPKGGVFNISIMGLSNNNIIFFWQIFILKLTCKKIFFGIIWVFSTNLTNFAKFFETIHQHWLTIIWMSNSPKYKKR
jgi:hypothetical protein